jgi:uncharacterized membrane protein YbhN (UPF0104 family)
MAGDNRSLIEFGCYREGLQRFEYFIVGVSLALCAYVGYTLHPEKFRFLSVYTIEVVSLALLILSAGVGLKRIESLVQVSRWNGHLLDAIEKRGAVMVAKPNSAGVIVVKYPGRILTSEEASNWVRDLNERIPVLHHMIEKETTKADSRYKWRNRLLLIGFCALVLSKLLTPYLHS